MPARRPVAIAALALGGVLYVWFAAVRRAGEVTRRKAERRALGRAGWRSS